MNARKKKMRDVRTSAPNGGFFADLVSRAVVDALADVGSACTGAPARAKKARLCADVPARTTKNGV
jgi:hypothetical protein